MGRACRQKKEGRSVYKIVTVKPTETRPLGIARRRWEDNIRIAFKEIFVKCKKLDCFVSG